MDIIAVSPLVKERDGESYCPHPYGWCLMTHRWDTYRQTPPPELATATKEGTAALAHREKLFPVFRV
jgi:hypothetical protein